MKYESWCKCLYQGYPAEITLVISNKSDVQGLKRAENAGIQSIVIDHTKFSSREEFDMEIHKTLEAHGIELVVLAGFMR